MADESKALRRRRLAGSLLVLVATSFALTLILQLVSYLGAKKFADEITTETDVALAKLTPLEMGRRYLTVWKHQEFGACDNLRAQAYADCMSHHPAPQGPALALSSIHAMFSLIGEVFSESPTQIVVDIMQLIAGFVAMLAILDASKVLRMALTFPVIMAIVPIWILSTCVLSIPMIGIIHFVSKVVGGILPEAGTCVFCGCWAGFVFECSGRTVEARVHHAVGHMVERILGHAVAHL